MKKFLLVFSLLCATSALSVKAQDYNWAIGVRGGETATGITVKHHFDPANGLEGIIDFAKGVNVYALYERHNEWFPFLLWRRSQYGRLGKT